ncbi:unnamed protein product [Heligmosomoides polygyrus]|uniref:LRRcap domain-containing protein n=1 Tax=Heligmosomoides polygyrus TaxID=6339 RepID=A0A183GJ20_HELPZ|nr:unnamed protein product [Heligmosomoides polygyrus]
MTQLLLAAGGPRQPKESKSDFACGFLHFVFAGGPRHFKGCCEMDGVVGQNDEDRGRLNESHQKRRTFRSTGTVTERHGLEEADKDKDKQKDAEVRDAPRTMSMIDVWDRVVVDIKVVNDQGQAQEVLRNLWSYRRLETLHLQGCALTDEDIAGVEHVNRRVKYLCLRGNDLCSPWQAFSTKFPELLVLDCRGNRCLDLPRRRVRPDNEAEDVCEVKQLLVDVRSLVARNGGISRVEGSARELCPKISRVNYSDVNIEDEGICEGGQEEGAEDDGAGEVESEGG